jgi:hypothetical protein
VAKEIEKLQAASHEFVRRAEKEMLERTVAEEKARRAAAVRRVDEELWRQLPIIEAAERAEAEAVRLLNHGNYRQLPQIGELMLRESAAESELLEPAEALAS